MSSGYINKHCYKLFGLFIFLFSIVGLKAQQNDNGTLLKLAQQAEQDQAFELAIGYYQDLYKSTSAEVYYQTLLKLYLQEEDFKEAEKLVKDRAREYKSKTEYLVDWGHVFSVSGEDKKAKQKFDEALQEINTNQSKTRLIAARFRNYNLYDYVEKCYIRAREISGNQSLFGFELAANYADQGDTEGLIEEYLNLLGQNAGYIQTVQNLFARILRPDPEGTQMELLRAQLLRRIQEQPGKDIYNQLLTWLYIQDENFKGAFIQAKALDRRNSEDGKRIYQLAQLCHNNEAYSTAIECYNYVIKLENSPYKISSQMKVVETQKAMVLTQKDIQTDDLIALKKLHQQTIDELRPSSFTYPLLSSLADLHAFHLNEVDSAIQLYQKIIEMTGLSSQNIARSKIALADLLLISGEEWEASLLYSQVEKEFKYDELGEIAKFKNAKIAFYTGDFKWAQAQLDVLKGSTSKLISNDAMDLSLCITDNLGLDSLQEPMEWFAKADLLLLKKDYLAAERKLDSIIRLFPASPLKDDILFAKYKIAMAQKNYDRAAIQLRNLLADYAEDILGDDALFNLAILEEEKRNNPEIAMELYKQLVLTYPGSLFVVESRKRFRALRGDDINTPLN